MGNYGFMGCGAVKKNISAGLRNGMMGCGALKQEGTKSSVVEDLTTKKASIKEVLQELKVEEESSEPSDLSLLHQGTLRKMATEKGYDGEDFSKSALIKFLTNNQ